MYCVVEYYWILGRREVRAVYGPLSESEANELQHEINIDPKNIYEAEAQRMERFREWRPVGEFNKHGEILTNGCL